MKVEGFINVKPVIIKIEFQHKGKMEIYLKDGRIIISPLSRFPSIKKLSRDQRKKWSTLGRVGFSFDDCPEVFHIEQVLGSEKDYEYHFAVAN